MGHIEYKKGGINLHEEITVGKRINKIRKEKNITSDKLAEMVGLTPTFLRAIESGGKLPSLPSFIKIANALEVSSEVLLCDSLIRTEGYVLNEITEKMKGLSPEQRTMLSDMIDTFIRHQKI